MLEAVEVSKKYWDRSSGRQYDVLQSCSLQIAAGEAVGLMGPSGCGKSTLVRTILQIHPATEGEVIFEGQNILKLEGEALRQNRRKIQMVFQDPYASLHPNHTLYRTLAEPLQIHREKAVEQRVSTALEEVGLSEAQAQEMYRYLAIANYEDRFVVPSSHREQAREAFPEKNGCGFSFGDGCHGSDSQFNLFNSRRIDAIDVTSKTEPHA